MSTQAIPQIPPRPTSIHDQAFAGTVEGSQRINVPKIPPRPAHRRSERSQSPQRDSFARSPLNEPHFVASLGKSPGSKDGNAHIPGMDLPRRPPSVTLPSLGQEGSEYGELLQAAEELDLSAPETRSVAVDLHLHAPKPSLPLSGAKQRVSAVMRTDSSQAAAFGIGKANNDDKEPQARSLKAKASNLSQSPTGTERPPTSSSDNGIPEIGQRVPMCPNAGDVQAPSPSPCLSQLASSPGFMNDGSRTRHHGRRTSARGFEGPPGSYGLHGHGIVPKDRFEQAYYEKHPDLLQKENSQHNGALGEGRGQWAMSSDDLNKIVRDTASKGAGLGTSPTIMGAPSEQIGFLASDEYASRISSPKPQIDGTQNSAEAFHTTKTTKDDEVVHVEVPESHIHAVYGDAAHIQSTDSLGPHISSPGEEGSCDEHGYGAPILASDEVAKDPSVCELQPAVFPIVERRGSTELYYQSRSESGSLPGSRPTSRPASIHGISSVRYPSDFDRESHHTALEDLQEYEPLFPQENSGVKDQKVAVGEDSIRPKLKNRKFPSQDVWEDAPTSLHYTATVSTPQLPMEESERQTVEKSHVREGDISEQEDLSEPACQGSNSFLDQEKKSWPHNKDPAEVRPGSKQRFPSRDVWEDSPDSLLLETTVGKSQEDDVASPLEESPTSNVPGREEAQLTTEAPPMAKPHIPARPTKQKHLEKLRSDAPPADQSTLPGSIVNEKIVGSSSFPRPPIPERSKPQVPARPAKLISKESPENVHSTSVDSEPSSKSVGPDEPASATMTKQKPPVPSRPVGGKIAALQAGFLSDLNKRLQLGPQAVKKEESVPTVQEEEKAPLVDARKGRARGPARRAPTKSATPDAALVPPLSTSLSFSQPSMLWHIHPEDGTLSVPKTATCVSTTGDSESSVPFVTSAIDQDPDESNPSVDNAGDDMACSVSTVKPDVSTPNEEANKTLTSSDTSAGYDADDKVFLEHVNEKAA